jgi:hypothetical protein
MNCFGSERWSERRATLSSSSSGQRMKSAHSRQPRVLRVRVRKNVGNVGVWGSESRMSERERGLSRFFCWLLTSNC